MSKYNLPPLNLQSCNSLKDSDSNDSTSEDIIHNCINDMHIRYDFKKSDDQIATPNELKNEHKLYRYKKELSRRHIEFIMTEEDLKKCHNDYSDTLILQITLNNQLNSHQSITTTKSITQILKESLLFRNDIGELHNSPKRVDSISFINNSNPNGKQKRSRATSLSKYGELFTPKSNRKSPKNKTSSNNSPETSIDRLIDKNNQSNPDISCVTSDKKSEMVISYNNTDKKLLNRSKTVESESSKDLNRIDTLIRSKTADYMPIKEINEPDINSSKKLVRFGSQISKNLSKTITIKKIDYLINYKLSSRPYSTFKIENVNTELICYGIMDSDISIDQLKNYNVQDVLCKERKYHLISPKIFDGFISCVIICILEANYTIDFFMDLLPNIISNIKTY